MERSHVEKQLYDAIKHTIRPSENDLDSIVSGKSVTLPTSEPVDIVFPTSTGGDAFGR